MVNVFLFNYHKDINKPISWFNERREALHRIEKDGYKVHRYANDLSVRRHWVEFETLEEAVEFKLRYL